MTSESFQARTLEFIHKYGRRPRILLFALGQSNPGIKIKIIALAFADAGFDVDISPPGISLKHLAKMAVENDVHGVWVLCSLKNSNDRLDLDHWLRIKGADDIGVFIEEEIELGNPVSEKMTELYVNNTLTRIGG